MICFDINGTGDVEVAGRGVLIGSDWTRMGLAGANSATAAAGFAAGRNAVNTLSRACWAPAPHMAYPPISVGRCVFAAVAIPIPPVWRVPIRPAVFWP